MAVGREQRASAARGRAAAARGLSACTWSIAASMPVDAAFWLGNGAPKYGIRMSPTNSTPWSGMCTSIASSVSPPRVGSRLKRVPPIDQRGGAIDRHVGLVAEHVFEAETARRRTAATRPGWPSASIASSSAVVAAADEAHASGFRLRKVAMPAHVVPVGVGDQHGGQRRQRRHGCLQRLERPRAPSRAACRRRWRSARVGRPRSRR